MNYLDEFHFVKRLTAKRDDFSANIIWPYAFLYVHFMIDSNLK